MLLETGARLGPYEIVSALGVGGMGEVYRAIDTTLKRHVAIKVLPRVVAVDLEHLARFQREAEVLAALNHNNIAHIFGLEKVDATLALVMEPWRDQRSPSGSRRAPSPLQKPCRSRSRLRRRSRRHTSKASFIAI